MAVELKVPSPGESITEVQIAQWLKADGDYVERDEEVAEIDSDKATLSLVAEASGILKILVQAGETVAVGAVVASIDTSAAAPEKKLVEEKVASEKSAPEKSASEKVVAEKVVKAVSPSRGSSSIPHFSVLNFINFFYTKDTLDNLHVM